MDDLDEHRQAALAAIRRISKARASASRAERDRDTAIRSMYEDGMTPPQISRALSNGHGPGEGLSISNVRIIIRSVPR